MKTEEGIKLKILERKYPDAYQGVLWLKNVQQELVFKKPVHCPIMMNLKIFNSQVC